MKVLQYAPRRTRPRTKRWTLAVVLLIMLGLILEKVAPAITLRYKLARLERKCLQHQPSSDRMNLSGLPLDSNTLPIFETQKLPAPQLDQLIHRVPEWIALKKQLGISESRALATVFLHERRGERGLRLVVVEMAGTNVKFFTLIPAGYAFNRPKLLKAGQIKLDSDTLETIRRAEMVADGTLREGWGDEVQSSEFSIPVRAGQTEVLLKGRLEPDDSVSLRI